MPSPVPFVSQPIEIDKAWIDYNGHLNMAYYSVIFDRSSDEPFNALGVGSEYARRRKMTTYTAEAHICYLNELHLGHRVGVTFQLLDYDEKRFRTFQEILHPEGGVAATCETLTLHVDMSGPKVAPMPADILANFAAMKEAHAALPVPERAGRGIALKRKPA